jgi:hypothetical protein
VFEQIKITGEGTIGGLLESRLNDNILYIFEGTKDFNVLLRELTPEIPLTADELRAE